MRALRYAPFVAAVAAGAVRMAALLSASPVITPDTFDYARQSRLPLLSEAFWGSQHPPVLPLLWKGLPGIVRSTNPVQLGDLSLALALNGLIATVCWGFLAATLARLARTTPARLCVLAGVLAVSLAPDISGWDASALSESLSLSLIALTIALCVRYATEPSAPRSAALGGAIIVATLTRDTNLELCALAVVPVFFVTRRNVRIVVCALVLAAVGSFWGQSAGDRAEIPTRNAVAEAIQNEHAGPWFAKHGLPVRANTVAILLERPAHSFDTDPRAAAVRTWIRTRGRSSWLTYLASHPSRTLSVRRYLGRIFDPPRAGVAPYWGGTAHGLFVHGPWLLLLALAGVVGLRRRLWSRELLVLASFLAATLPVAAMVWDADSLELYRHAIVLTAVAQLVSLTAVLLSVEAALQRLGSLYASRLNAATAIPK